MLQRGRHRQNKTALSWITVESSWLGTDGFIILFYLLVLKISNIPLFKYFFIEKRNKNFFTLRPPTPTHANIGGAFLDKAGITKTNSRSEWKLSTLILRRWFTMKSPFQVASQIFTVIKNDYQNSSHLKITNKNPQQEQNTSNNLECMQFVFCKTENTDAGQWNGELSRSVLKRRNGELRRHIYLKCINAID